LIDGLFNVIFPNPEIGIYYLINTYFILKVSIVAKESQILTREHPARA